jgi:Peptidase dimerisation domain
LEIILNNYWRPTLSVIGLEGLPTFEKAGNVIYQKLSIRCSMRLPPTLDSVKAKNRVIEILSEPDNYNTEVQVSFVGNGTGFNAPKMSEGLQMALEDAHQ